MAWKIIVTIAVIGWLFHMFGFIDYSIDTLQRSEVAKWIATMIAFVVMTGCLYVVFALWHKLLGPCFL
jgi:hypothetical protein